jgi:hypothetical protein
MLFLSVVLRVKIFNLTTRETNLKYCSNFDNFLKQIIFFFNNLFPMFNVLFVGYSLAKNNLNSTYQYNMIPKKKF